MRSGRLRDWLTIQSVTHGNDSEGGPEETWTDVADRPCDIQLLRGAEFYRSSGENVHIEYRIRFRYEPGLLTEERRLINKRESPNKIYDIQSVIDPDNKKHELILVAIERKWPIR